MPKRKLLEKMLSRQPAARVAHPQRLPEMKAILPTAAELQDLVAGPGEGISLNLRFQPQSMSKGEGISLNPKLAVAEAQIAHSESGACTVMKQQVRNMPTTGPILISVVWYASYAPTGWATFACR